MRRYLTAPILLLCGQIAAAQPQSECARVEKKRLDAGQPFSAPLPHMLEFRMRPSDGGGWRIDVGPAGDPTSDYLSPVSPPYQSAPHLVIGPAYGVSAAESIRVTPREFRFVLNEHDRQLAWDIASAARLGDMHRWKDIDKLPRGTLRLTILDAHANDDAVEWVAFAAEACMPGK